MKRLLVLAVICVLGIPAAVFATEAESLKEINDLVKSKKIEEAEAAHKAALKEYPDSTRLKALHYSLYLANARARQYEPAAEHISAYVDYVLVQGDKNALMAKNVARYVGAAISIYSRAGKPELGREKLEKTIAAVKAKLADNKESKLGVALTDLLGRKVSLLANSKNKKEQAEGAKLVASLLADSRKNFKANSNDATIALALANVLRINAQFVASTDAAAADVATDEYLNFAGEQTVKHPENAQLFSAYLSANLSTISRLSRSNPLKAEEILNALKKRIASIEPQNATIKRAISGSKRSINSYAGRIAAGKKHLALIGQPMPSLDVAAWVNGAALTNDDLKGKVVLLDFWAVWCGPCIATFPHLREWDEKFADKGLVIIGLTRYYSYEWDEDTKRAKRVADLTPMQEHSAAVKFAKHHELTHRFGYMPKTTKLPTEFGVTGIPQAVLIDRNGKIRLIRVGSGPQNAHDIEELLLQLLEEPVDTAAGS